MNTVAVIGRMLLALVFVLGIMWCLARWARKPMGGAKTDRVMTVLARQQISRTSSVTVLRVMDRALVLGVTEQGVRLITETELSPIEEALAVEPSPSRSWSRRRPALLGAAADLDDEFAAGEYPAAELDVDADESAAFIGAKQVVRGNLRPPVKRGSLDGSVLSVNTWRQMLGAARDLTVRR
ncbi:MAG: FliO/MopB family protein [Jatrophihabitans sp.]